MQGSSFAEYFSRQLKVIKHLDSAICNASLLGLKSELLSLFYDITWELPFNESASSRYTGVSQQLQSPKLPAARALTMSLPG